MRKINLLRLALIMQVVLVLISCRGESSRLEPEPAPSSPTKLTQLLQAFPTDVTRQAVRLHPSSNKASNWQVLREWPQGEVRILARDGVGWKNLPFPQGATVLLKLVMESSTALYLFTYDVERNIPSGRSLKGVREGIDLWRVDRRASQVTLVAQELPLGGADNVLVARENAGTVDVCTIDKCLNIADNGEVSLWAGVPAGYELVELRFANDDAYALVRQLADRITGTPDYTHPPYAVVTLRHPNSMALSTFQIVEADCLPFRLRWYNGRPNWSCAKNAADMAEVLQSDLQRTPLNGIGDLGLPNTEGRIAWGLVYSLNALVHLDKHYTPQLAAAADWQATRAVLGEALGLIARQGSATKLGHASRRYSTDRSPMLFALHLGRIAQLLSSGKEAGFGSTDIARALDVLRVQLETLKDTAEAPMQLGSYTTLGYRRGIAFWADGANVPHNYVSGYVLGLLASAVRPADHGSRAAALLSPLLVEEDLANSDVWHYWWKLGRDGWTEADNISTNTPAYSGYKAFAHITYRSMDAMAILRLAEVMPTAVDQRVVQNLRRLVANGNLLPFVNQELVRLGGAQQLNTAVALRHARSAAPWELHAQLFALEALAKF